MSDTVRVGVIGVGSMGRNHVRVYDRLSNVDLVGVADADAAQAATIADEYGTESFLIDDLLSRVDAVSIAVPTEYHAQLAEGCIAVGVDALVEKPFVADPEDGRRLARAARAEDVILQVGHIERFNPAVRELLQNKDGLDILAVEAHRLGPPVDRQTTDTVIMDLMIHDIDVVLSLVDAEIDRANVMSTAENQHATAQLGFENGVTGTLTASRVTQRKVRQLHVTAASCLIELDYIDQSINTYRRSNPQYSDEDGALQFRHENVIEQPMISSAEPLREELESFVDAVATRRQPVVTAEDATRVLDLTKYLDDLAVDGSGGSLPEATSK